MPKHQFRSYAECEEAYAREKEHAHVSRVALNEVMHGTGMKSFRRGRYRVLVCRPTSPTGGYIVVTFAPPRQAPFSCAYYAEQWINDTIRQAAHADPGNQELRDLIELAHQVRGFIHEANKPAPVPGPAPEVV